MHIIKLSVCDVKVLADRMCERIRERRYVHVGECYSKGYDTIKQGSLVGLPWIVSHHLQHHLQLSKLKQEYHLDHFLNLPTNLGFHLIQ